MGLKLRIDKIPRQKLPGSSIIYLPSGKYLKYATFGYSSLLADLIYIWAIQYYSSYDIPDRFKYLEHIFSIISVLDPHYLDPYELGAMIAIYEAHDAELAFRILDMGYEKNPQEWIFPYIAGHYAQMFLKDYRLAQKYYKQAMVIEGSPPILRRLYAHATYRLGDYQTAWQNWLEIYQESQDQRIKNIALSHLYLVKSAMDKEKIEAALHQFREKFGHYPERLEELVQQGFLSQIPKDLDGREYLYNKEKGTIKAPRSPWKK
jgi:tetratricopeptide (TPR) repeat protein